jgi:uncharacterized membrane protein
MAVALIRPAHRTFVVGLVVLLSMLLALSLQAALKYGAVAPHARSVGAAGAALPAPHQAIKQGEPQLVQPAASNAVSAPPASQSATAANPSAVAPPRPGVTSAAAAAAPSGRGIASVEPGGPSGVCTDAKGCR